MIAKGNFHSGGVKLAAYLVKGHPGERGELIDMRGFGAVSDLRQGFRDEQIKARDGTKADAPFFHVQFRAAQGEGNLKLSRANWAEIADRCDRALGPVMSEQPRAVSLHIDRKTGDMHLHLGYSLVREAEDGRLYVQKLGLYKNKLKHLARELEKDYGLKIVSNERQPHDRARIARRGEVEESRRLGTDVREIRTAILDSLERSDNGKAFKAALEGRGFVLANGDRRDCVVVIDALGGQHAVNKKLTGLTLAQIRDRLADLDRSQLPSVDRAKEMQAERQAAREAQEREKHGRAADGPANARPDGPQRSSQPEIKPLGQTAGEIRLAWQLTKTAEQFAQAIEDRGLILVHVSREEAEASQRAAAFAKAIGRQNRALKEGFAVVDRRGNVTRIDQRATGDQLEEIQKRLAGIDRRELVSVADAKEAMREANRIEWREQRRAEREAARPATALETAINDLHQEAADGKHFAEALDKAGVTIARATAADVKALDALRQDQELNGIVADAAGIEQGRAQHFARLEENDLAAVTRQGDVFRISAQRLEQGVEARLAEGGPAPGVIEARAALEIKREAAATFQQQMIDTQLERRAEATEARVARSAARDTRRELERDMRNDQRAVGDMTGVAEQSVSRSGRLLDGAIRALAKVLDMLADMFAPAPPPTKEQAERMERVAEEQAQHSAQAAEDAERREFIDQLSRDGRRREEDDLERRLAEQLRRDLETRGRENDHSRGRERER
jgi:hypothetical protein